MDGTIFCSVPKVRDYECDLQRTVNNVNYQYYMEHACNEFLETAETNSGKLHNQGIDVMVARVKINNKFSLLSGDRFAVKLNIARKTRNWSFSKTSTDWMPTNFTLKAMWNLRTKQISALGRTVRQNLRILSVKSQGLK